MISFTAALILAATLTSQNGDRATTGAPTMDMLALNPSQPYTLIFYSGFSQAQRAQAVEATMRLSVSEEVRRFSLPPNTLLRVLVIRREYFPTIDHFLDQIRKAWEGESAFQRTMILACLLDDDLSTIEMKWMVGKEIPFNKLKGIDLNSKDGPLKWYPAGIGRNPGEDVGFVVGQFFRMDQENNGQRFSWDIVVIVAGVILFALAFVQPKGPTLSGDLPTNGFGDNFSWNKGLWATVHLVTVILSLKALLLGLGNMIDKMQLPIPHGLLDTPTTNTILVAFAFYQMKRVRPITADTLNDMGLGFAHTSAWVKILCGILAGIWLVLAGITLDRIGQIGGGHMAPAMQSFFGAALLAPLHEEFFYRLVLCGFIYKGLLNEAVARQYAKDESIGISGGKKKMIRVVTIVITALIFMAPHILLYPARWGSISFVVWFTALGMLCAGAYVKGKTIVLPILVHGVHNATMTCLAVFSRTS